MPLILNLETLKHEAVQW